jgi:hypothetical protein
MALVDELKSGYEAGDWNNAPIYRGGVWTTKITLTNTPDINGLTFTAYARKDEFSTERLFDIAVSDDVEGGNVVLFLKAADSDTAELDDVTQVYVVCQFEEDSSGDEYPYFAGYVPVEVGGII